MAIQVFGGNQVQSAFPSYIKLNISPPPVGSGSLTLVWPSAYVNVPYTDPITNISYQVLALSMDVITAAANTNTITLPDATQTSIGQIFNITNVGESAFTLNTSNGDPLQVCATGITYYVTLTNNSNSTGVWRVITLGAGTSEASATALAGNGLVALADKLNTDIVVVSVAIPPAIDTTYRAKLIVWTGGAANLTLPLIASVPAGFYVSFSNQSNGNNIINIQPAEVGPPPPPTIGGKTSIAVAIQQSLTIISDGTNWQTLGFGQNQFAVDTVLNLNVSGGANVTLTNIQAANIIQKYFGTLTGNITVFFPIITSDWFIYNNTMGSHTLSVQLAGPTGTSYVIPQGSIGIFYSDGTSMFSSPNSLALVNGTEAQPSLYFSQNTGTGIWATDASSEINVSIAGHTVSVFIKSGPSNELVVNSPGNMPFSLLSGDTSASIAYDSNSAININSSGAVAFPSGVTGQILAPDGTGGVPTYSFSSSTGTGIYYDSSGNPALIMSLAGNGIFYFANGTTANALIVKSADLSRNLQFICNNTTGSISYNTNIAISINSTGVVTFPIAPLPIGSGGTNAQSAAAALNNLMPAATAGSIVYYNGTNWVNLPVGTTGNTLQVTGVGTIGWV